MIPYAMAQPFLTKQIIIHQPFLQCAAVYSKSFRNLIKASSSGIALLRCMDFHFRTDQCRNDAPRVVRKFFSLCLLYGEQRYLGAAAAGRLPYGCISQRSRAGSSQRVI